MGRTGTTGISSFCINGAATRVRLQSKCVRSRPAPPPRIDAIQNSNSNSNSNVQKSPNRVAKEEKLASRRVIVVADSKPESEGALRWTLSHAVQGDDTIVLLDVIKPCKKGDGGHKRVLSTESLEHLNAMKNICHSRKPEVKVEMSVVQGRERGPAIVEAVRKQGPSLLVLGQRRRVVTWRLMLMWMGDRVRVGLGLGGGRVSDVEYCIQNAPCMTLAVRKKTRNSNSGGYLITSRRHRDFWLLA